MTRSAAHRGTASAAAQAATPRTIEVWVDATQDNSTPEALRALKRFERHVTLLGGVASVPSHRSAMWVDLRRGTVWAVDTQPSVREVDRS